MYRFPDNYPLIMGIINLTSDSFYSESCIDPSIKINNIDYKYADIVDVGCESSRPGSEPISEKVELERLTQFLENNQTLPNLLSIDTYKPSVARLALNNGFAMINDIMAGGNKNKMMELAAEYKCPIVLMHMRGLPRTMQKSLYYKNIIDDLLIFFEEKFKIAEEHGIKENKLILDPGIGFGKRIEDNDIILNNIHILKQFKCKVLIGVSRKSFLSVEDDSPSDRLAATIGVSALAMKNGVDIIRAHDIYETYKLKTILNRMCDNKGIDRSVVLN